MKQWGFRYLYHPCHAFTLFISGQIILVDISSLCKCSFVCCSLSKDFNNLFLTVWPLLYILQMYDIWFLTSTCIYLLMPMDRTMLPHSQSSDWPYYTAHRARRWVWLCTRQQASVNIESTLQHRPKAACTVRLRLHWFDLLSTYCTSKFATNLQQIELIKFEH